MCALPSWHGQASSSLVLSAVGPPCQSPRPRELPVQCLFASLDHQLPPSWDAYLPMLTQTYRSFAFWWPFSRRSRFRIWSSRLGTKIKFFMWLLLIAAAVGGLAGGILVQGGKAGNLGAVIATGSKNQSGVGFLCTRAEAETDDKCYGRSFSLGTSTTSMCRCAKSAYPG